jgi:hypothetical protein
MLWIRRSGGADEATRTFNLLITGLADDELPAKSGIESIAQTNNVVVCWIEPQSSFKEKLRGVKFDVFAFHLHYQTNHHCPCYACSAQNWNLRNNHL